MIYYLCAELVTKQCLVSVNNHLFIDNYFNFYCPPEGSAGGPNDGLLT